MAQDLTGVNSAPAVAACNSLYVRYVKEKINTAAFPCKLFKGVSTWREEARRTENHLALLTGELKQSVPEFLCQVI